MTKNMYILLASLALPLHAQDLPIWAEKTTAIGVAEMPKGELSKTEFETLQDIGEELFGAKFTSQDGAGRPKATQAIIPTKTRSPSRQSFVRTSGLDANACASCHNEPTIGGAGGFVANVFVSEGFANHDFNTIDPEFSNERGSNHLFGAGLIELLAREMSADLRAIRSEAIKVAKENNSPIRVELISKGIDFGFITAQPSGLVDLSEIEGVDTDLIIRPFSQKGVFTSLRQFTVNAMNHHHGMQPTERFGARWTGEDDFDEDGYANELSRADISALVAWQAGLAPPLQKIPENEEWAEAAKLGQASFVEIGCASCHQASLPLTSLKFVDPGPFDASGTLNTIDVEEAAIYNFALSDWASTLQQNEKGEYLVPLFGDLKRHKITDSEVAILGNELLSQRFVGRDEFMTGELWGVASTEPYGHRNDITTLDEIIRAHGGEGRASRDAYISASADVQSSIIAYLKTLTIEVAE